MQQVDGKFFRIEAIVYSQSRSSPAEPEAGMDWLEDSTRGCERERRVSFEFTAPTSMRRRSKSICWDALANESQLVNESLAFRHTCDAGAATCQIS